jgi:drug/metabolite transporter (DMT)-like permease
VQPLLLAIASAAFYGSADFIGGLVSRRVAAIPVVLISQAAGLLLVGLLLPLLPDASPTPADFWWGAGAGVAGGSGVGLLYYALAIGTMSAVAPTTAVTAVAIPVIISIVIGERPGALAVTGILLGVGAIVLVGRQTVVAPPSSGPIARPQRSSGLGIALGAGVAIGIFLLTLAQTRAQAGLWPLLSARFASVALVAAFALARRSSLRMPGRMATLTIGGGVLDMAANALYLVAAQTGPLSPVVTLSSLYPASTVLLARVILGERLNAWQIVGVVCALIAVVLIVGDGR